MSMYLLNDTSTTSEHHQRSAAALVKALSRSHGLLSRCGGLASDLAAAMTERTPIEPAKGDRRFADSAWSTSPVYRRVRSAYLALERAITDAVEDADVDWRTRERARFAAGILSSALAPTNTLVGNPAALKHAFDTCGASLVRGTRNLARDVRHNRGMPRQVDTTPFRVGENIGATPGQVVFRNELVEIIQYTPRTPTIRAVPLLVVWSVINRFYVLDLAPDRSFIEFALDQGVPVFVTSWRNPTQEHADRNLDSYAEALIEGMDAVMEISGSDRLGTLGLCAGGQLLAATMAHLSAIGDDRIAYTGFGVSQLDMSVPSAAGLALHRSLVAAAKAATQAVGVVDGRDIAAVFSWLRPNELVWSNWVNNYLMGNDPAPYDILAWNNDTTRVTGALQRDMLSIAEENLLARPGALTLLGSEIDLGRVTADTYVVGAETDHLVPWHGAFRSTQMFGGETTFVLSGGGHIQHLVNPPGNPKAHYRTGVVTGPDPEAWRAAATKRQGTWWRHWAEWALARSGEERPAPRSLGSARHQPLELAPGRYVREQ
jgi:polyhydroxyalkanoate synthase